MTLCIAWREFWGVAGALEDGCHSFGNSAVGKSTAITT
jgi:hypothetical protein